MQPALFEEVVGAGADVVPDAVRAEGWLGGDDGQVLADRVGPVVVLGAGDVDAAWRDAREQLVLPSNRTTSCDIRSA